MTELQKHLSVAKNLHSLIERFDLHDNKLVIILLLMADLIVFLYEYLITQTGD